MRRIVTGMVIGVLALGGVAAGAGPAFAENNSTVIAFDDTTALTVPFGTDWVVPLTVSAPDAFRVLDTPDGTVDVTASGVPGSFAPALTLFRGGRVFLSQPTNAPPLGVGTYQLDAAFEPASGSTLDASQTAKSFTLTITGFAVGASAHIVDDPATVTTPVVQVSLDDADYVKATGGHPAGRWKISVNSSGGASVFDTEFAQPASGSKPLEVAISPRLRSGRTYTVSAQFVPDAAVAAGLTLTNAKPITYQTPAAAPLSFLTAPVAIPLWGQILIGLILAGLIAAVIALAVQVRRRRPSTSTEPGDEMLDV
jgi:hypothetical protein